MLLWTITIALIVLFIGWLANRIRTRRMRTALGRNVQAHELTSLTSWMEVSAKEDEKKNNPQGDSDQ